MLKIGICDDEPIMIDTIKNIVSKKLEDFKITSEIQSFTTGESLLVAEKIKEVDGLFLDIELNIITGIEIVKILRKNMILYS